MKRLEKIGFLALVLITATSLTVAYYFYRKANEQVALNPAIAQEIQTEATIIARNVDKQGLNHVTIEEARNIIHTTALALEIQKKKITAILKINTSLVAENLQLKKIDTAGKVVYKYKDRYLTAKFTPPDSTDSVGLLDFNYNADLTVTNYTKKKWLLSASNSFIDIYSNDPRTTVNGVKRLVVQQDEPNFGLRLQLRSIYSIYSGKVYAGPGLSLDFKRLNVLGYSYYNLEDKRWQYNLGLNYDLIRF